MKLIMSQLSHFSDVSKSGCLCIKMSMIAYVNEIVIQLYVLRCTYTNLEIKPFQISFPVDVFIMCVIHTIVNHNCHFSAEPGQEVRNNILPN